MKFTKKTTAIIDLMTLIFSYTPAIFAISLGLLTVETLPGLVLKVFSFIILVQIYFVIAIFIIRILLPRLEPGVYKTGFNRGFFAWYAHSMLTRSARCFGLHYLLHCTSTMRWLYWRALGANIAFNMNTSYKVTIHDAPVLQIGSGTTLAEDVEISGHLVRGDKVLVAPVKIGQNVFVGRGTYIGPRTKIANGAWIGMNNILTGKVIAENQTVKSHEFAVNQESKIESEKA